MKKDLPIGVFDSGVGGLTVLNQLVKLMPKEKYLYIADLKNSPYGEHKRKELINFADKIFDYFNKVEVKAVVIACNTASSLDIEKYRKQYDFPIFTVVEEAIESLSKEYAEILVAATTATVESKTYSRRINKLYPNTKVIEQACKDIVPAIESGEKDEEKIQNIVDYYISDYKSADLLILGCTHYPIWREYFENTLKSTQVFDPAYSVAERTFNYLKENELLEEKKLQIKAISTKNISKFVENSRNVIEGYEFDMVEENSEIS